MTYVAPSPEKVVKEKPQFGIFSQVLTVILAIALIPVSGLFFTIRDRQASQLESLEDTFESNSDLVASVVDNWVDTNILALRQNAETSGVISMDPNAQLPILKASESVYDWSYVYFTLNMNGDSIARSDGQKLQSFKDRSYFIDVAENGASVGQQVLISRTYNVPALCLSVPIRQDIQPRGVLVSCSTLSEISEAVVNASIGRTGFAFLVDDAGRLIAHGDREGMTTEDLEDFSEHPALQANTLDRQISYNDEGRSVTAYVQSVGLGWKLVVQQDVNEAFEEVNQARRRAIILVMLTFSSTIILAYLFAQRVSNPIKSLTEIADNVSRGQLDATIEGTDRQDEIGELARAIKRLTASVKVAFDVLKNK
ncbi:MAG: cache domain-containing protein [Cyanobacteria bacterium P01_H01_bin.21]